MKIFDSNNKMTMAFSFLLFISMGCGKTSTRSSSSGSSDATISDISMTLPRRALLANEVPAIKRLMTHYRLRYETVVPCASRGFIEVAAYRDEGLLGINVDRSCEILLSMEYGYNLKSDGSGDVYYASNRMRFSPEDLGGIPLNLVDNDDFLKSESQKTSQNVASQGSVNSNSVSPQVQENNSSQNINNSSNQNNSSQDVSHSSVPQDSSRTTSAQQSSSVGEETKKKRYFRIDFDMRITTLGKQLGLKTETFRNSEEVATGSSSKDSRDSSTGLPSSDIDRDLNPASGIQSRDDVDDSLIDDGRSNDDDLISEPFEGLDDDELPSEEGGDENQVQKEVTYNDDIQLLLSDNCTSCHSPGGVAASIDLSTEDSAKNFASQSNSSIQNERMPPSTPLASEDKEIFDAWIESGAQ